MIDEIRKLIVSKWMKPIFECHAYSMKCFQSYQVICKTRKTYFSVT